MIPASPGKWLHTDPHNWLSVIRRDLPRMASWHPGQGGIPHEPAEPPQLEGRPIAVARSAPAQRRSPGRRDTARPRWRPRLRLPDRPVARPQRAPGEAAARMHGVGNVRGHQSRPAPARRPRQHGRIPHRPLARIRRHVAAPLQPRTRGCGASTGPATRRACSTRPSSGRSPTASASSRGTTSSTGGPSSSASRGPSITPTGARWEQAFSPDGGRTWEKNWIMTMTRTAAKEE